VADGSPLARLLLIAERALSGPLNAGANSSEAAQALLALAKGGRMACELTERVRSAAVHALDLPSRRDVQLLDAKVERLQRTLDELFAERGDRGPGR
jgi:hypothetical protein